MKQSLLLSGILLCALTLTGCYFLPKEEKSPDSDMTYDWGITMTAENITPTSADIRIAQNGGNVTGELHTGTYYIIERQENGAWTEVPQLTQEGEVAWPTVAFPLENGGSRTFPEDWSWLYGELPEGNYRLGKWISDFRGTGDYDDCMYYAEFTIN